jgi:hypothetical protein
MSSNELEKMETEEENPGIMPVIGEQERDYRLVSIVINAN